MDILHYIAGLFYWIINPIVIGIFLLPFSPYIISKLPSHKQKKMLSSLIPFWCTIMSLALCMNWIWTTYFNGRIFYEWDTLPTQYSLMSYQAPLLDGSGTWIAKGWQIWYLYILWMSTTIFIYIIGILVSVYVNRKKKDLVVYRKILIISSIFMFLVGLLSASLY